MANRRFVIVDGNALIHRAYHAIPPLNTKDGLSVNAVYGFTSILLKILSDLKPSHIAVSFDVAGATFRDEIYEEYKATRVKADDDLYDQIPLCYEVVEALDIPIFTKEGYEADDVIGTLVTKFETKDAGLESVIVTGDKDMLQLVDDQTKVYMLRKGMSDFMLYDEAAVKEQFGFPPKMIIDYKALMGDSSDNIPGVKGVGKKTAEQLLVEVGDLSTIYDLLKKEKLDAKPAVLKKLEVGEGDAWMSYELATIITDVKGLNFTLKDALIGEFNRDKVLEVFSRFEFVSLMKRLPGNNSNTQTFEHTNSVILVESTGFGKVFEKIAGEKILYIKEVLSSDDVMKAKLQGLVIQAKDAVYFFEMVKLTDGQIDELFELFRGGKQTLVGHDVKKLLKILLRNGVELKCKLFDIMVASYLINSSTRAHDMPSLVLKEFGSELKEKKSQQGNLFGVDASFVTQEVSYFQKLHTTYLDRLQEDNNLELFENMEMALIPVLATMEVTGISVDTKKLSRLSVSTTKKIEKLVGAIHKAAGEEFNVASSVQLRDILFEKLGLSTEGIKKGKTGYSTAASELEKLRDEHEIIPLIEEFRELEKLRNTYIDVLPTLVSKETGRIHTHFNQAVASTGRLSSADPNLQNIPIRTDAGREIRKCFVSEKGKILVAADYSQIELRVVASLAKDKAMIEIFENGEDIHTATAAAINGVKSKDVTKEMRRAAKAINFGILYGMGAFGMAVRTGIPQWQAKEFIDEYFKAFAGVKKYMDRTLEIAKKDGYVETLFGRRRYIPELSSGNVQIRNAGERMAINMPVQGTAADIMKEAMIAVDSEMKSHKSKVIRENTKMLLQVHDELVLETPEGTEQEVAKMVKAIMQGVVKLGVPVVVDVEVGTSWGEMK
ncbi:DNA polymerase I [Candidatus Nomurabacteria bacterium]|nr:DNA polymerase I [Candidatus Nomurabacteria bacterium]